MATSQVPPVDPPPYLKLLHKPNGPAKSDIVFIHGLNPSGSLTHPTDTWTHENGCFWPRDLLSSDLPDSRIWLYAYNSSVAVNVEEASIKDHANYLLYRLDRGRRINEPCLPIPIVWIGHSLGGLVAKQALLNARDNQKYQEILDKTYGLVFFGVPHRGGRHANFGKLASKFAKFMHGERAENELLDVLTHKSLFTEEATERFRHQLENYKVVSFFETRPLSLKIKGLSDIIVDKESATLGLSGTRELQLSLNADHSSICKIPGRGVMYENVGDAIVDMVNDAEKSIPSTSALTQAIPVPQSSISANVSSQLEVPVGSNRTKNGLMIASSPSTPPFFHAMRSAERNKSLLDAVEGGQLLRVKYLIEAGADLDCRGACHDSGFVWSSPSNTETALHKAAWRTNLEIVQLLCSYGANINVWTTEGYSPLDYGVIKNCLPIVQLLIDYGAQVNIPSQGRTPRSQPLHLAIAFKNETIVGMLLDAGASVGFDAPPPSDGEISKDLNDLPLTKSIRSSLSVTLIARLLHQTEMALVRHQSMIHDSLSEYCFAIYKDVMACAALYYSNRPCFDILRCLIDSFAEKSRLVELINSARIVGQPILCMVAKDGNHPAVRLLLENGAKTDGATDRSRDTQSEGRMTALMIAAEKGYVNVTESLLEYNANPNLQSECGRTAAMFAAQKGHKAIVTMLINAGADTNLQSKDKKTAMMFAAERGHEAIVSMLISAGANVSTQDINGATVLVLADICGHANIVHLLESAGSNKALERDKYTKYSAPSAHSRLVELSNQKNPVLNLASRMHSISHQPVRNSNESHWSLISSTRSSGRSSGSTWVSLEYGTPDTSVIRPDLVLPASGPPDSVVRRPHVPSPEALTKILEDMETTHISW